MEASTEPVSAALETGEWEDLFEFDAPYLEEKLLQEGIFQSKEEYEKAFEELKKFFILTQKEGGHLSMTSEKVDDIWHQFILFTPQYIKFCKGFFGGYIHHVPNTSHTSSKSSEGGGKREFIQAYIDTFGELPDMWGIDFSTNGFKKEDLEEISSLLNKEGTAQCENSGCGQCSGCKAHEPEEPEFSTESSCSGCTGCEGR